MVFFNFASFTNYKYSDLVTYSTVRLLTIQYNRIEYRYLHYLQGDKLCWLETLGVVNYVLENFRNLDTITFK